MLNVVDTTARHDLLPILEAQYGQSISLIKKKRRFDRYSRRGALNLRH